jgi:hypothetical protein
MIYRNHPIRSLLTSTLRKANIRYPSDVKNPRSHHYWNNAELQTSCVFAYFTLWKQVKTHVLSDQSVHITHTYCCVSKLSKSGFSSYLLRKPHLFVILTAIGWFIVIIQSDLFWHRCLERQAFGTPRKYTLSSSKSKNKIFTTFY